jgi:aspartate aminotransferase
VQLAQGMSRIGTETAFRVLAKANALEAQGVKVVHLEIGEPDFDTAAHITQAAIDALRRGETHYTAAAGIPLLRQAAADYASRTRGIDVNAENIVVTPGGKPIMFFTMLALLNPGDEAIYPNPGFPIYESMINFIGATPVPLPLREKNEFRFDIDEFRSLVTDKTKLVIINSPQNPSGSVLEPADLEAVAEIARERDLMVLSDEIYSRMLYEGDHLSIASLPGMLERTIILDGFSKTYAMTGWRLGYGVMSVEMAEAVATLQVNSTSCTNSSTQFAGEAALNGPQDCVDEMLAEFGRRRDVIVDGLNAIPGFKCLKPKGAFYVFPNISATGMSDTEFADRLLSEAGVAVLAGSDFGAHGEGYLRMSYANSIENIELALERIREFMTKL